MATLACPNCQHDIQLIVQTAPGVTKDPAGALTAKVLRAVLDFMRSHPGKGESNDLYERYCVDGADNGWPAISPQTFYLALKRNGAGRWRTAYKRGYDIPEIAPEEKPASPPPSVVERHERQAYLQTIDRHQASPGITINPPRGLPLEVEGY